MIDFDGTLSLGALSDWVSGIATAIAVIITLVYSQRQSRREDETRLHALYAWAEQPDGKDTVSPKWAIVIRNDTQYPIYDWSVIVAGQDGQDLLGATGPLNNTTAGLLTPGPTHFDWLPSADFSAGESAVHVTIRFRDARGAEKTRSHTGELLKGRR